MLGYLLFRQDKPEEALPWLEKAAQKTPDCQAKKLRDHVAQLLEAQKKTLPSGAGG